MNTKMLMVASGLFLALAGAVCLFAPVDVLQALGAGESASSTVFVQLTGALYLAFAMTNWAARGSMIGGIYSRPLSVGNFVHFAVGALVLLKHAIAHGVHWPASLALVAYSAFAVVFSLLLFVVSPRAPTMEAKANS